jgi:N-acetylmuramoyl-L-alanine amidase
MRRAPRSLLLALLLLPLAAAALAQSPARPLVVIDAGHGGVDAGARGPAGTLEKHVALAVARELADLLSADDAVEVRLTREADVLVPLTERTYLANRWREETGAGGPAIFVSIHTNAHEQRAARGVETYFLSEALTEDARRVAAMENAATRFERTRAAPDPLAFILDDLRQNLYLRESSDGAAIIQRRLAAIHPGPDRGVKQAGFIVLDGAFMPAVLVELGFLTNHGEEALLASRDFQRRAAGQLAAAIHEFFARPMAGGGVGEP